MITCDISEGVGKDYTVFMFSRMVDKDTNNTECVGFFKTNTLSKDEYALILQLLCCKYCNPDRYLLSIEWNTYGELFLKTLWDNMDRIPEIMTSFDPNNIVKYYNESGSRYICGIKITAGNKTGHCLMFKDCYEKNVSINRSAQFMMELDKFTDDGTGHYRASFGHDDMVMAQVQLEFVKETLQYKLMRSSFDSDNGEVDDDEMNMFDAMNMISRPNIDMFFDDPSEVNLLLQRLQKKQ